MGKRRDKISWTIKKRSRVLQIQTSINQRKIKIGKNWFIKRPIRINSFISIKKLFKKQAIPWYSWNQKIWKKIYQTVKRNIQKLSKIILHFTRTLTKQWRWIISAKGNFHNRISVLKRTKRLLSKHSMSDNLKNKSLLIITSSTYSSDIFIVILLTPFFNFLDFILNFVSANFRISIRRDFLKELMFFKGMKTENFIIHWHETWHLFFITLNKFP